MPQGWVLRASNFRLPEGPYLGPVGIRDLDGDGRDELGIGVATPPNGFDMIVYGRGARCPTDESDLGTTVAGFTLQCNDVSVRLARGHGDFNGDGIGDLFLNGGPKGDYTSGFVVFGPLKNGLGLP